MMRIPVILFGLGQVGCTFLRQLLSNRPALKRRLNLYLVVVGLADRRHTLFEPER
jgi:homoserine dehydrogenase